MDATLPDGYSSHLPTAWFAKELKLKPDTNNADLWYDAAGKVVFQEFKGEEEGAVALLRMNVADQVVDKDCTFISVLKSERIVWPGGGGYDDKATWRRPEGVCWQSARGTEACVWQRDNGNGTSKVARLGRAFCVHATLGSLRLYDLRHTAPSQSVMSGENLFLVGKLLGHRRHRTTAGYAHLADEHLVEVAEKVGYIIASAMKDSDIGSGH